MNVPVLIPNYTIMEMTTLTLEFFSHKELWNKLIFMIVSK